MVDVAQLVRASVCGTEGRRFEPGLPPKALQKCKAFFYAFILISIATENGKLYLSLNSNLNAKLEYLHKRISKLFTFGTWIVSKYHSKLFV